MIYLVPPQGDRVRHARSRGCIVDENKTGMKKDLFGMIKQDGQRRHSLDVTHALFWALLTASSWLRYERLHSPFCQALVGLDL